MPTDTPESTAVDTETAALLEGFLTALGEDVRVSDHMIATIRERHAELLRASVHLVRDHPSRAHLRTTLAMVAACRVLLPSLGPAPALDLIRQALLEPVGPHVHEFTRRMLDDAEDAFEAMVRESKARETDYYGETFEFVRAVDDESSYHLDVHRCFFHDVFTAHDAPELTPILCEFDSNWIEAIDPDRHGLTFERPTTIGLGGTHCPFHFARIDRSRDPNRNRSPNG